MLPTARTTTPHSDSQRVRCSMRFAAADGDP